MEGKSCSPINNQQCKQQMHQAVQFSEGQFQKEIQLLDEQTQNLQQRYDSQLDEFRNLKMSHV